MHFSEKGLLTRLQLWDAAGLQQAVSCLPPSSLPPYRLFMRTSLCSWYIFSAARKALLLVAPPCVPPCSMSLLCALARQLNCLRLLRCCA